MINYEVSNVDTVMNSIRYRDTIVIYRDVGGIGDAVMITGAVAGIRKEFGGNISIVIATTPLCAPIYYNNPNVDWIIDSTQFDRVRRDRIVLGSGKDICKDLFESAGAIFIPLSDPCPCAEYESANEPSISRSRHEIFSNACGVKYSKGNCRIYTTVDDRNTHTPYVVYHGNSANSSRNLPRYHNRNLISILSKKLHDIGYELRIVSDSIPLSDTISIIANSSMLVGVDSMGVHVAGALGVPVYGIFGPTDPTMRLSEYNNSTWYKGYKGCSRMPCWYHPCLMRYCMRSISMNDLANDIIWWLDTNKRYGGLR